MIKPELLEDAKRCADLCHHEFSWEWTLDKEGKLRGDKILGEGEFPYSVIFNPYNDSFDLAWLTKAVFEHPRRKSGEYHIIAANDYYDLYKANDTTGSKDVEEKNMTDFCIRAIVVLEGL